MINTDGGQSIPLNSKPTLFKITKLNWVDVMRFQRERQMCLLATVVINTVSSGLMFKNVNWG